MKSEILSQERNVVVVKSEFDSDEVDSTKGSLKSVHVQYRRKTPQNLDTVVRAYKVACFCNKWYI